MTRTTVPTGLMPRCQIADPQVQEHLLCQHYESGGVQCENPEQHTDDHWISEHTISHALAGNGYACTAFDPAEPVQSFQGPVPTYTEQQMVDALLRCAADRDSLPRNDYIRRRHDDEPSAPLLERRFGSWNAALERAGLNTTEQPLHFQGATTKWTEEMILDALRECWIKTGSITVLAYEAWRTGGTDGICRTHVPPAATIRFRMGSWSRATQLAVG